MPDVRPITLMVARIPDINSDGKSWTEQAQDFVDYYRSLDESKGSSWMFGLLMAKQWARLLSDTSPDLHEAKLLLRVLEAERAKQGTGWSDMCIRIERWIAEIEGTRKG
jgi:hypothetical protein